MGSYLNWPRQLLLSRVIHIKPWFINYVTAEDSKTLFKLKAKLIMSRPVNENKVKFVLLFAWVQRQAIQKEDTFQRNTSAVQ